MTPKQRRFIEEYTVDFNATQAAKRAGYSEKTAYSIGEENLKKPEIAEAIEKRKNELQMSADEAAIRMGKAARLDLGPYLIREGRAVGLDIDRLKEDGLGWVIKGLRYDSNGRPIYDTWDSQRALEKLFEHGRPQLGTEDNPLAIAIVNTGDKDIEEL